MNLGKPVAIPAGLLMALVMKAGGDVVVTTAELTRMDDEMELAFLDTTLGGSREWRFLLRKAPVEAVLVRPPREINA
jgi:hypothetical protein